MATYIKVSQSSAAELLEANARQTAANRAGLARQEKAKQMRAAMPEPAPQVFGSRRVVLPEDELAATRRARVRRFAHAYWQADQEANYPLFNWKVFCGDLSQSITAQESFPTPPVNIEPPSIASGISDVFLPVDGETGILTLTIMLRVLYRVSYVPSVFATVLKIVNRAYVLNKTTIRQVTVPSGLAAVFAVLNPNNTETTYDEYRPDGLNTSGFAPRTIYIDNSSSGLYQPFFGYWRSPQIYEQFNRLAPFTSSGNLKQFPSTLKWVTPDLRYGQWAPEPTSDKSLYFADWLGDPIAIDPAQTENLRPLPRSTYLLPSSFAYPTGYPLSGRVVAWDWDDPAYCRAMCSALGFQPSDLVP